MRINCNWKKNLQPWFKSKRLVEIVQADAKTLTDAHRWQVRQICSESRAGASPSRDVLTSGKLSGI